MPTEKISGRIFFAFAILLAWISVAIFHKRTGRRISEAPQFSNERWFLTYILLALLAGVIVQRKFLSYHYIPFFTLCWPALAAVWMEYSRHLSRWSRPATGAMVLVAVVALYPWKLVLHYVRSGFSLSSTNEYVLPDPIYGVRAQQAISDYVDQRTRPNERVEFASFFPGPRWRIDRLEATRFTSLLPLLPQTPNHHYTSYQIRWRAEFVDQLQLLKPQYIVIQEIPDPAHTTSERFTPVFERMFKIPGLSELLESQYHKDTTFDSCTFYRRNGS